MEESQNWLDKEVETLSKSNFDGEKLPSIKFEENKISQFDIDFSNPFDSWTDAEDGTMKKIIPVTENGEKKVWWCNIKNPIYSTIVKAGQKGQTDFRLKQTGSKKNTRYELMNDIAKESVNSQPEAS